MSYHVKFDIVRHAVQAYTSEYNINFWECSLCLGLAHLGAQILSDLFHSHMLVSKKISSRCINIKT